MAELTRERSGQVEEEELALPDDRFHVPAEQIEQEHVSEQMPRTVVEKRRGEELPAIGGAQPVIAEREIFADKSRLVGIEEKLGNKNSDVRPDQSEKDDSRPLDPAPGGRRRFSAGKGHVAELIATKNRCRWTCVLARRQDAQAAGPNLEFHRTIAHQLAINLHRHALLAGHAKPFGLEIFDFR